MAYPHLLQALAPRQALPKLPKPTHRKVGKQRPSVPPKPRHRKTGAGGWACGWEATEVQQFRG